MTDDAMTDKTPRGFATEAIARERAATDFPDRRIVIHFATRTDADERVHMGPALCRAGYQHRTEREQFVAGDWTYVDCMVCVRMKDAKNAVLTHVHPTGAQDHD